MDFKNNMIDLSSKIGVNMENSQIECFFKYMNILLEWNEKINLTAITEQNDIILKHFIDSLTILKYFENNKKVIDVGTGAGFPGIPISIMRKDLNFTLLDSLNKRILFLNEVVNTLKLDNVKNVHGRAEEFAKNHREIYDYATSRAVANVSTLTEYLLPFVKIGGKCICMKGPDADNEIENAKFAIKELGGKISFVDKICLPNSDISRTIVIIDKIKDTPKKYPRKAGTPSKQPLGN